MASLNRDLVGYASEPPNPIWPQESKIAIQFVLNYEEGGEHCILNGDNESEHLLSEIAGAVPYKNQRHMNMESIYEYGSRAGFWRLHHILKEKEIPCTGIINDSREIDCLLTSVLC